MPFPQGYPALAQALQRARVESRAGADRTEAQRMLRETILAAERDKARAMGADQEQRGRQEEAEHEQLAELEAQRRQVVVGVRRVRCPSGARGSLGC